MPQIVYVGFIQRCQRTSELELFTQVCEPCWIASASLSNIYEAYVGLMQPYKRIINGHVGQDILYKGLLQHYKLTHEFSCSTVIRQSATSRDNGAFAQDLRNPPALVYSGKRQCYLPVYIPAICFPLQPGRRFWEAPGQQCVISGLITSLMRFCCVSSKSQWTFAIKPSVYPVNAPL